MISGMMEFPRELTRQEKYLLFSVLPEYKPGYNSYREKINKLCVTAAGRYNSNNLILGRQNTVPDITLPPAPVFAAGTIKIPGDEIDILINEEVDDEIEIELNVKNSTDIPEEINELERWSYSDWNPGNKSPGDNGEVREVVAAKGKYILVFAPSHKKIWLHDYENGVNYLIPLTNFYNELMRFKGIKDPAKALNPKIFFQGMAGFSDYDLINALVLYSKYMRRFTIDFSKYLKVQQSETKNRRITDMFRKGKN
ncbi:MAG TPA: hypothetical protein VI230_04170 [Ignavibacteriaceae bacterium]